MRSQISLAFQAAEYLLSTPSTIEQNRYARPLIDVGFLTLAGNDGPLPFWVTEKVLWEHSALHEFLDILNRRFWELSVVAESAGVDSRYARFNPLIAKELAEVTYSAAALGHQLVGRVSLGNGPRSLLQYAVTAARGIGGVRSLARLISDALNITVRLHEYLPVRLEIVTSCRAYVGKSSDGRKGLGDNCVLGTHANIACGLQVQIVNPQCVASMLAFGSDSELHSVKQILRLFYVERLPPIDLRLCELADPSGSKLGSQRTSLKWGAHLHCSTPFSNSIAVSRRAFASAQLKDNP